MGLSEEELELQRIREEARRNKEELQRLQEEELRHIQAIERIKQGKQYEEAQRDIVKDKYGSFEDSAFSVNPSSGYANHSDSYGHDSAFNESYDQHGDSYNQHGESYNQHGDSYNQHGESYNQYGDSYDQYSDHQAQGYSENSQNYGNQYGDADMQHREPSRSRTNQNQNPQRRTTQNPQRSAQNSQKPATKSKSIKKYSDDDSDDYRTHEEFKKNKHQYDMKGSKTREPVGKSDDGGKKKKRKKHGCFGHMIRTILFVVLILAVVVGLMLKVIFSKFNYIETEVSKRPTAMQGDTVNILLIGEDAREGQSGQRSDTMILCSINRKNKSVALTSIMRDMYVNIPDHGGNRINAAFALGGVDLLDKTIEEDFGITIDGNAMVDFTTLLEAMTAVGDIEIELDAEEANYMNENPGLGSKDDESDEVWNLTEGVNVLTPSQVLAYSRMRYVGNSDWDRTERQRKVIMAAVQKVKSGHLISGFKMADGIAPCITTDVKSMGMLKLAWGFMTNDGIQSYRLPVEGTYYNDNVNGMAVLVPDMAANSEYLKKYMSGEYSEEE